MTVLADVVRQAAAIPPLSHAEAGKLSQTEYARVVALLETLAGDDWARPTYCTEWTVRDMVAHLAGGVTGSTSVREFLRQNVFHPYVKEAEVGIDGTNRLQIEERADKTTAELVAEFRENGRKAVKKRQKLPWLIRKIPLPMEPMGRKNFQYLMDIIYPRDEWMHRYDICAATGREMVITPEHDGRMVELVLWDIASKLEQELTNRNITVRLVGALAGDYQFGRGATPECTLEIDVFDLNLRASERIGVEEALGRTFVTGDEAAARWFLTHCNVLY